MGSSSLIREIISVVDCANSLICVSSKKYLKVDNVFKCAAGDAVPNEQPLRSYATLIFFDLYLTGQPIWLCGTRMCHVFLC